MRAETAVDAAMRLAHTNHAAEARAALQSLVDREPNNAGAWHALGLVLREANDTAGFEQAADCLKKAVDLDPHNETYLADYGGTSMELAGRTRSISAATNGRSAMEKAVEMNPDDLDAREGLFQYYNQAPFFVGGSSAKAAHELEEIRKRDPDRATVLEVITKTAAKDFDAAFEICDRALAKNPDNYAALYQYGRAASLSGRNLERGLACLQRCLTLEPPTVASPRHTHAWYRLGDIQLKLAHGAEAKAAFEESLKLDSGNRLARAALDRMR
jgi:tetratricopeptide (TPR) repeat protein